MDKTARPRLGHRAGRNSRAGDARARQSYLTVNAVCVKDCIAFVSAIGRVVTALRAPRLHGNRPRARDAEIQRVGLSEIWKRLGTALES